MLRYFFPARRVTACHLKAELQHTRSLNRTDSSKYQPSAFNPINRDTMASQKQILHLRSEQKLYEHRSALASLVAQ
jgi:hypothetical protein